MLMELTEIKLIELLYFVLFSVNGCFTYFAPSGCLVPKRPEEGAASPGTGATNGRALPCGCWGLTPASLEKPCF